MLRRFPLSLFVALIPGVLSAVSLYVAPDGSDQAAGTQAAPLQTPQAAAEIIRRRLDVDEIVLLPGTYAGEMLIRAVDDSTAPALTVRAATPGTAVLDGGLQVSTATAAGAGVWRFAAATSAMWETDTRRRYQLVADARTVAAAPATFAVDDTGTVFHTSDGQSPATHVLGAARDGVGIRCMRSNVTIDGIAFRNLHSGAWASGVMVQAANVTIRNCTVHNARCGFFFYSRDDNCHDCRVESCEVRDAACGVYCMGEDVDILDSRFFKKRDGYMVPAYWQDDTGIQFYAPSRRGNVRGNLVKGFANGIYIKCPSAFYTVEHNTVIDATGGLYRSANYSKASAYVRNIVADVTSPFFKGHYVSKTEVDYNCLWQPKSSRLFLESIEGATRAGYHHNVVANPLFVDAANDDYRLLPSSPCVVLARGERPWGALAAVPADVADTVAPVVSLILKAPAARAGSAGQLITEMDPWLGGERTVVDTLFEPHPELDYVVSDRKLDLEVIAVDAAGKPTEFQMRFDDEAWSPPAAFERFPAATLPAAPGRHRLAVKAADGSGNWSEPVELRLALADVAPTVVGEPRVYASQHGVVISFVTDRGAFSAVEYGATPDCGRTARQAEYIHRDWRVMDGADWISEWRLLRTTHQVSILSPLVHAGGSYHYRIVTRDAVGNRAVGPLRQFTINGESRDLVVAVNGEDGDGRGDAAQPFATIQYAVDRALPGDRVLVRDGVYVGETYVSHGGLPGAPITIAAVTPRGAVLDGVRATNAIMRLENVSHVTLDGFEIRWFDRRGCGVYAADCSDLVIRRCKLWNFNWSSAWGEGVGVFLHRSPGAVLEHNVMLRNEQGFIILQSPRTSVRFNTALRNTYGAVGWSVRSGPGSEMIGNSFAFNGNDQVYFETLDDHELATFRSDYNNFGATIGKSFRQDDTDSLEVTDSHLGDGSKAILRINDARYLTMDSWREATGWDAHSIFADPKYVDVKGHDFRLQPDSPNIGSGPDGSTIGAGQ